LRGLTVAELRKEMEEKQAATVACGRPKKGPSASEMDKLILSLELKVITSNFNANLFNFFLGWVPGIEKKKLIDLRDVAPLNHARVVDDLIRVHGHEILVDGMFNGDPHPGNFLLVHSSNPSWSPNELKQRNSVGVYTGGDKLGLIDYGQAKSLSLNNRLKLARLIVALNVDDKERVAHCLQAMGHKTKYNNTENHYTMAKLVYDSNDPVAMKGRHIQRLLDELQSSDPIIDVAEVSVCMIACCHVDSKFFILFIFFAPPYILF
jgi:aarF domain-containing kinase